jgi:SAM-dependent methyltransferase
VAQDTGDRRVRGQYEAHPYPARDPADEAKRLVTGSPSHILEIDHYVFGGGRRLSRPFRALVAGGGTGDAAIMLAQQLADAGREAEVVYLDVSTASLAIARARADARGLSNVRFLNESLLDLDRLDLGRFDYIDCCGVLHHLEDPAAGLAALAHALAEDGGMGLMLYGKLGRTGVYHMQAMLGMLAPTGADGERLALARRLIDALPETNWFRRNPFVRDHLDGGDAGLFDLLLHSRDQAFTVPEIAGLVASAGLEITAFIEPALYDPASHLADEDLSKRAAGLAWIERCALAELLAGSFKRHVFYVAGKGRAKDALARPANQRVVPVLRDGSGPAMARRLKSGGGGGGRIGADLEGVKVSYRMPALAADILMLVDGRRSLGAIHGALAGGRGGGLDWLAFKSAFDRLYAALNGLNVMLLRTP